MENFCGFSFAERSSAYTEISTSDYVAKQSGKWKEFENKKRKSPKQNQNYHRKPISFRSDCWWCRNAQEEITTT